MKKKSLLFGILAAGALVTLASCGNDQELEDLKKEVASLKEENSTLKNDKDTLTQSNQTLSDEKKALKDSNDSLKEENKSLKEENDSLVNDNDTLNYILAAESDKYKEIHREELKNNNKFEVAYVDFLGDVNVNVYDVTAYSTVLAALKADNKVDSYEGAYGTSISNINDSFVDGNWYFAIYENFNYASTGIDGLEINAGDVFEFKHECWNTVESGYGAFDSFDVLVDKAIYNYYINILPTKLQTVNDYTGITYWDSMALYKLKNTQSYGAPAYSFAALNENPFSTEYVNALNNANQSELSGNNLFKYYYADRLVSSDRDYSALKTKYQSYLDTLTSYPSYGEYYVPFHTGVAKTLGLNLNDAIKNTTYRADMTYGPEGLAWELAGLACYNTFTKDDLSALTIAALDNEYVGSKDVALSTYILPYAASNISFRELKDSNDQDALKVLFSYYDESTMQFDTEKLSNDMSSNQIYAALVAYKIQRDTASAQNLFE